MQAALGVLVIEIEKRKNGRVLDGILVSDFNFGPVRAVASEHSRGLTGPRRAIVQQGDDLTVELVDGPTAIYRLVLVEFAG